MSRTPNLILPANVQAEREQKRLEEEKKRVNPKQVNLPPHVSREVRKHLEEAETVETLFKSLLNRGDAGVLALLMQPTVKDFITKNQSRIFPQLIVSVCQHDRSQIINAMTQIMENETIKYSMQKDSFDVITYKKALTDLQSLLTQMACPKLNFDLEIPEFIFTDEKDVD